MAILSPKAWPGTSQGILMCHNYVLAHLQALAGSVDDYLHNHTIMCLETFLLYVGNTPSKTREAETHCGEA